jgi:hypothetical protein
MPIRRWTLTRSEELQYRRIAERMRAAGAELDPSAFATYESPWISLKISPVGSYVRARPTSCVFVLALRIVGLVPKLTLQGFDLSSPAWPLNAYILDDPTVSNSACKFYRLLDGEKFYREEILNHRVEGDGRLGRGDVLEGLLLAESLDSVPSKLTDHSFMPLCLSIVNQFDDVHECKFAIQVERIPSRIQPRAERRSTLCDGADGSPPPLGHQWTLQTPYCPADSRRRGRLVKSDCSTVCLNIGPTIHGWRRKGQQEPSRPLLGHHIGGLSQSDKSPGTYISQHDIYARRGPLGSRRTFSARK